MFGEKLQRAVDEMSQENRRLEDKTEQRIAASEERQTRALDEIRRAVDASETRQETASGELRVLLDAREARMGEDLQTFKRDIIDGVELRVTAAVENARKPTLLGAGTQIIQMVMILAILSVLVAAGQSDSGLAIIKGFMPGN